MPVRVAINGFGRIGRCIVRAGWNRSDIEFVHINDLTDADVLAYLLHRDTVHGTFGEDVRAVDGGMVADGRRISISAEKDPSKLPWKDLGIDIVLECTGVFTKRAQCAAHLAAGAKRVIISAPADDADATFVMGVNDDSYDPSKHIVVSNASCTTNCLAPLVKVMHEAVGIEKGLVNTIHSYTMDQHLLDAPHKKGLNRRMRAAAQNMVPTSTGAAKAIGLVYPALKGKLDGQSIRVPTANVSIVDLTFTSQRETSATEINGFLQSAAKGKLKGILQTTEEPIVSSDLIGNRHSSIADLPLTQVIGGNFVKVLSWYDNEWGFSNRMADLAVRMGG
ncbi:MAG: type I glyceraldehyde-3-phosphate dehydrogenase [Deltaproteobacteria bacterium]|nr:type I glyceraldehyde-3-phosphate dehydrogenase [Deltaproteobacteria bacterium]